MKKVFLVTILFFVASITFAQKMMTRSGEVKFEASMPAFEEIAGTNGTVSCVLDTATGEFASLVLVKSFKFKSPLMEEHFNENYMESDKFPKSTFKGKIANFNASKPDGTYDLEGDLTIHGVTKKVKTKVTISNNGKTLVSNFSVKTQDYNIKIPSVVKSKIAESVKITSTFQLENK
jgi:hypothetical protein